MNKNNINPSLFLDDDFKEVKLTPEKVVCLGMEFESEDARRAYFREELRKKLPELKQIEGFPIGEDEDIINLSDPPYYTACPNPWLNDFIAEWEKEKVELEKEGKRKKNFEVKVPYASDVSEGKRNPIYNVHTYHTKVPHPAIMRYILHYTQPGDIVLDGFCGTGMTGVAAQLCGNPNETLSLHERNSKIGIRHAICSDISPIATFISSIYNKKNDVDSFLKKSEEILEYLKQEYGWMYKTKHSENVFGTIQYVVWSEVFVCPQCGKEIIFYNTAYDSVNNHVKDSFKCPSCGTIQTKKTLERLFVSIYDKNLGITTKLSKFIPVLIKYKVGSKTYVKSVDTEDIEIINRISELTNMSWIPTYKLQDGYNTRQPINSNGITNIHQFYSDRNLFLLSKMLEKIGDDAALKLWFTSQLINISKLNRYRPEVSFPYNPLNGTLYISSLICESNIFEAYKNKKEKILFALNILNKNNGVSINSASSLCLFDNSIDYIFTDPPFGSNIMYSDLNSLWEGWIKVKTNIIEEAIINSVQGKTLFDYQDLMHRSFEEYYRVLKPGKWMTIEFSNTSAAVWNAIQNALQGVGFVIANVAALDKKQGSFKAVTTTTAVKQDLVITCYKPTDELMLKFETSIDKASNAMDFIEELLVHLPVHLEKDNSTTAVIERSPKILYDRLISYYVQHGYAIPMDAQEFQKGLRERFIERDGMFFTASQALEYEEKKKGTNGIIPMALFISSEAEGIEWLKRELETPQTYADIQPEWMKAMSTTKKGDILPELMTILEENFIKGEDGKWRKPDPEKAADLEIIRNRKMMKEFNIYLEQAQKPKAKRMKETRLEVLRYGFKECYKQKDYKSIILVGDHIQESLLQEDEVLLQYYDIASTRI